MHMSNRSGLLLYLANYRCTQYTSNPLPGLVSYQGNVRNLVHISYLVLSYILYTVKTHRPFMHYRQLQYELESRKLGFLLHFSGQRRRWRDWTRATYNDLID